MNNPITEITRIRFENSFWLVEVLSAISNRWLVQGVHKTLAAAKDDQRSWA